ncbi:MAG: hypothetical protein Fues2KO_23000 [Fuerstiella sp.]
MKRLILMRHSYAAADNPAWSDKERPLTEHGRDIATRTGQLLSESSIDRVIHSSACRTTETAQLIAQEQPQLPQLKSTDELYLAPPAAYRSLTRSLDDDVQSVIFVGHNPGIGTLIRSYAGDCPAISPGCVAIFDFDVHHWSHLVAPDCSPSAVQYLVEGQRL